MVQLGDRIKYLREKRELTQKEVSKRTGLTIVQISRYENNERKPDPEALAQLVDALDTNADYLLGRIDDPSSAINEKDAGEDIYVAYLGGPKKVLDQEEAAHLDEALEMFRAFREKKRREMDNEN